MGLFSGSSSISIRPPSQEETGLRRAARGIERSSFRRGLSELDNIRTASALEGREADRLRLTGRGTADIAQAAGAEGVTPRGVVARNLAAARARSRLGSAVDENVDANLLRERASVLKRGVGRQGLGLQAVASAAGMRDQVARGDLALSDFRQHTREDALGVAAGTAFGLSLPDGPIEQAVAAHKDKQGQISELMNQRFTHNIPARVRGLGQQGLQRINVNQRLL